jgi:hypothetical protein
MVWAAGAPGTRGDMDEVRLVTVSPRVSTMWPIVSRRAGGERPEEARRRRALGADAMLVPLRVRTNREHQGMRRS